MLPDFRVRQRDYLLEITRAITQELDLSKVLARILHITIEMLAGQAGIIALREPHVGWRVAVSHAISPAFLGQIEPLLAKVSEQEESARTELLEINQLLQRLIRTASMGLLTGVALPLIARNRIIGILFVFRNYMGVFSTNDKALLQSFADQAAIAVHNAQLYTKIANEEQRLSALLDSLADGILIMDATHTVENCNPALARMLGVSVEEIRGAKHEDVLRWVKLRDGLSLEQAEVGGWPLTPHATLFVEGDLERLHKPALPVGVTYSPLLSPDGKLLNIIASIRDITRFREAEELKSTFVSVISHELKTPVALIKGYVSTLRREDAAWDRTIVQDSLAVIEEEADRLTGLIENLLDATRLQAGVLAINQSDVALDQLARRIAERFKTQTNRHTFRVEFPAQFPVVLGDEVRLEQVLSNLISNAIKYSPDGGEIAIRGQVHPEYVVVCVSDQGPGIEIGDIPYVFDRFYRSTDASRTTKGAGLGLYLSRAVVEAHGGRIWVDPTPGEGARICFNLPRDHSDIHQ
ncbi:MAG: GAF domain-containing protein [Anaerolineales bacterium]|nr:GAF domain-containing protein [Anaerolineales bacterium]